MFKKDVFPVLRHMNIHDITRAHLLDIIARVEGRDALSVAEKLRTWFTHTPTDAACGLVGYPFRTATPTILNGQLA